jgi:hypothetical protein
VIVGRAGDDDGLVFDKTWQRTYPRH